MSASVWILVVLLVTIAVVMGRRLYGKTLDQLFDETEQDHHRIHAVLARHPQGGTWQQYSRWLAEAEE